MDIKYGSCEKTIDIEHEIINKKSGSHYINLNDREKLDNILNELHKKDLFNKYDMSYTYTVHDDYIVLVLYKIFEFMK